MSINDHIRKLFKKSLEYKCISKSCPKLKQKDRGGKGRKKTNVKPSCSSSCIQRLLRDTVFGYKEASKRYYDLKKGSNPSGSKMNTSYQEAVDLHNYVTAVLKLLQIHESDCNSDDVYKVYKQIITQDSRELINSWKEIFNRDVNNKRNFAIIHHLPRGNFALHKSAYRMPRDNAPDDDPGGSDSSSSGSDSSSSSSDQNDSSNDSDTHDDDSDDDGSSEDDDENSEDDDETSEDEDDTDDDITTSDDSDTASEATTLFSFSYVWDK